MNGSWLPWLKSETAPLLWLPGRERSAPVESTGQVSTRVKPCVAVNSIGYTSTESSHDSTAAFVHQ